MEQLHDNLRLLAGPPISGELREEILRHFAQTPESIVTPFMWSK
jgi:hypothetical protein